MACFWWQVWLSKKTEATAAAHIFFYYKYNANVITGVPAVLSYWRRFVCLFICLFVYLFVRLSVCFYNGSLLLYLCGLPVCAYYIFVSRQMSLSRKERARHGAGHGLADVWALRSGKMRRAPDAVVWPNSEDQASNPPPLPGGDDRITCLVACTRYMLRHERGSFYIAPVALSVSGHTRKQIIIVRRRHPCCMKARLMSGF